MRKLCFILSTILTLIFIFTGCGNKKVTLINNTQILTQNNNKEIGKIINSKAIGFLQLGTTDKIVIQHLGEPETKSKAEIWGADGIEHQTWRYSKQGIELDMIKDNGAQYVKSIRIENPCVLKTNKNIGIGNTKSEVNSAYQNEINKDESSKNQFIVGTVYDGIIFNFKDDKIVSIFIGSAAE